MKFKCENSKQVAREQYYMANREYTVEVPDEMIPHHIRVWLIDEPRIPSFELDDATPENVINELQKLIDRRKHNLDLMVTTVLAMPSEALTEGRFFYQDSRCGQTVYSIKQRIPLPDGIVGYFDNTINWSDERLVEKELMVRNLCAALNFAEQERMEKTIEEIEKKQAEKEAKQKEDEAIRIAAVRESLRGADLQRFEEGLMSEDEQRKWLRGRLIPVIPRFELYKKIKPEDVCDCGENGDYDFSVGPVESISASQYTTLCEIREAYPDHDVKMKLHLGRCDSCNNMAERVSAAVETTVGDWTLNRHYELV